MNFLKQTKKHLISCEETLDKYFFECDHGLTTVFSSGGMQFCIASRQPAGMAGYEPQRRLMNRDIIRYLFPVKPHKVYMLPEDRVYS